MKLKRLDIFGLEKVFTSLMENPLDPDVAYKVASNLILAGEFTEKIRKSYKAIEGYDKVQEARAKLLNDNGGIARADGSYEIPNELLSKMNELLEAFATEHKELLDKQAEYQAKFDELLEKESDVDFKTIDRKELTGEIEPGKLVLMIKTGILTDGDK
jgi:single-stranded DNA-specific DHH superfamily exonuclease